MIRALALALLSTGVVAFLGRHLPPSERLFASTVFLTASHPLAAGPLGGGLPGGLRAWAAGIPALLLAAAASGIDLVLLGDAVLLGATCLAGAGLRSALGRVGIEGSAALALSLVAVLGAPFAAGPAFELVRRPPDRAKAVRASLALNPAGAACDLHGVDWLRRGRLYDRSPIGSDVPYRYPRWIVFAAGAGLAGGLGLAAGSRARRSGDRS